MNSRALLTSICAGVCLAAVCAVFVQRQRLADLRGERARFLAESERIPASETVDGEPVEGDSPPAELLRLRSEVTRLSARQLELAGAGAENETLRAQLAEQLTNAPPSLPPDYMLRSKARWAGFATPENTVQSFLWALERRNFEHVLQTLTPEAAEHLRDSAQNSERFMQEFNENAGWIPGMRILSREQQPDGSVELHVEYIPGMPTRDTLRFRQIDGGWKMEN